MAQLNFPDSPTFGTVYAAPNGVNYTYTSINGLAVWTAVAGTPLTVTGGTIVGPAYSGNQLTYTPGVPAGGAAPYVITYQWLRNGVVIPSATALTYTLVPADVGTNITAKTNVTDASTQTASGTSNSIGPIAAAAAALTITSAGSIAPSSSVGVGDVLTYTTGTFTGGVPTVTQSWVWKRAGVAITGTVDAPTYTTVTADAGQAITVTYTVTDSATPTANTANQTTTAVTPTTPFPSSVWNPTPSNGLDSNPGGQTGTYNGTATSIITTGCVEASVNGGPYSTGTQAIVSGQSLAIRWSSSGLCGGAASGTNITGSVSDGTYTNSYSLTLNRVPASFTFTPITGAALSSVNTSNSVSITGINSTAYVTADAASTGTSIQGSINGGGTWANISASGTGFPVANSDNLLVRLTTNGTVSSVNTAIINIGDGDNVPATLTTSTFSVTNTASAVFPNTTFTPVGGPNASPANTLVGSLDGTATATWADGTTSLTTTGCMEVQVNSSGFSQGPITVNSLDTVSLRWSTSGACGGAASGTVITGTLTNTTYTNTFSLTVVKQPTAYTWSDQTGVAPSATVTSNVITIAGINCPAELTYTAGATNTLTSVQASIDGGAYVNIPTSSPGLTINPADAAGTAATTIQLQATVGAGVTTAYTLTTNIGKGTALVSDEWSVTTSAAVPSITTPNITTPANNTTNVDPGLNTPAAITLIGDSYSPLNGAGTTQTSSTWEVYQANLINPQTSAITNVVTSGTSPGAVGDSFGGGYYAGDYTDGGVKYNLILAPKSTERSACTANGAVQYKTSISSDINPPSENIVYGQPATDAFNDASHPACQWAKSLSTGGYLDWYVPADNEGAIIFNAFAPLTTSIPDFQVTGTQAFCAFGVNSATGGIYETTTQDFSNTVNQIGYYYGTAGGGTSGRGPYAKSGVYFMRAVRRQAAPTTTLTLTNSTNLSTFQVNDSVTQVGGGASGTIGSINVGTNQIVLSSFTGTWTIGSVVKDISRTIIAPAPTLEPPGSDYVAITGSPFTVSSSPFTSNQILQSAFSVSSTYYARVKYATTNTTAATSSFSAWSRFGTASAFTPPVVGTQMGGGYFAGQINSGGLFNIIVAPIRGDSTGPNPAGPLYGSKPTSTSWSQFNFVDDPTASSYSYGKPGTDSLAGSTGYPLFYWCKNDPTGPQGIGGFYDWYIPATYEMLILYFFLKPNTTANQSTNPILLPNGNNPNSVSPYTPNTSFGTGFPAQTTSSLFQTGGAQAFDTVNLWWTSSQEVTSTPNFENFANYVDMNNGSNYRGSKSSNYYNARAIRRVAA